ncbi:MAG: hypothetical protein ACI92Z_003822, partial [Paracoccaceae bacterium]
MHYTARPFRKCLCARYQNPPQSPRAELWLNLGDGVHSGDAGFIGIGHFDTVVELDA